MMKILWNNKDQMTHFMVYVRWDIILDWKGSEIIENKLSKNEHMKPYAYGTGARGILKKIKPGDILWVFTLPVYGRFYSFPSMVAMLTVEDVIDQLSETDINKPALIPSYIKRKWDPLEKKGWRYVITGNNKNSQYFPINDAYDLIVNKILKIKSADLEKKISGKHFGYIARHFQTIRRIPLDLYKDMLSYKEIIHKSPTVFISYRRKKSSGATKALAESLLKNKINCWLDVNRMPQHISEQDIPKVKQYFIREIENAIRESNVFVIIKSDDYFEHEWTNLEYKTGKLASESGKLTVIETDGKTLQDKTQLANLVKQIVSVYN